LSVAFRVQTACTRFFLSFFPAPLYTRVCIMRGPVYRNAFFFFSSHNGSGDDRKRKYRELCRQSAAVVILHCPPSNCTIRASRKPVSRVSRDRAPRPPLADLSKVHRYVYTIHQFLPFTGSGQTDSRWHRVDTLRISTVI